MCLNDSLELLRIEKCMGFSQGFTGFLRQSRCLVYQTREWLLLAGFTTGQVWQAAALKHRLLKTIFAPQGIYKIMKVMGRVWISQHSQLVRRHFCSLTTVP